MRVLTTGAASSSLPIRVNDAINSGRNRDPLRQSVPIRQLAVLLSPRAAGVAFGHSDISNPDGFATLPHSDFLTHCSAEPSIDSGIRTARYVWKLNLNMQVT